MCRAESSSLKPRKPAVFRTVLTKTGSQSENLSTFPCSRAPVLCSESLRYFEQSLVFLFLGSRKEELEFFQEQKSRAQILGGKSSATFNVNVLLARLGNGVGSLRKVRASRHTTARRQGCGAHRCAGGCLVSHAFDVYEDAPISLPISCANSKSESKSNVSPKSETYRQSAPRVYAVRKEE